MTILAVRKLIQFSVWVTSIWDTFKVYLAASRRTRRAMTSKGIVHVVDDDEALRRAMTRLLRTAGFETVAYDIAQTVLNAAPNLSSGCMLLDLRMPGMDGLELLAGWVSSVSICRSSS